MEADPSGEQWAEAEQQLLTALRRVGISEPVRLGRGVVVIGGTPGHRFLEISLAGNPIGQRVLASSEEDIAAQLDGVAMGLGVPRGLLDVIRPEVWPISTMFPRW